MKNLTIAATIVTTLLFSFAAPIVFAQGQPVTPAGSGPPTSTSTVGLGNMVENIFNLALLVSGILAFGAVIYGAFMYTFSAGNPSMQSDARDQITQAFLG
ncbi:MAG: hypothetical protein V1856_00125, partial [Candidatus Liptonbacteria bacterium]